MAEGIVLDLTSLNKAIVSLSNTIAITQETLKQYPNNNTLINALKSGVIQNFEFTYELSWKFMKRWLESNLGAVYVDGIPRKELFKLAAEHRLIDNPAEWFVYHQARNEMAHTYNLKTAEKVFTAAISFLDKAKLLLNSLEQKK
jgi:nucleotidyltransferase substrate binding protein (TIGR01987 family)